MICKLTNLPLGLIVEAWRLDEVSIEKEYGVEKKKEGVFKLNLGNVYKPRTYGLRQYFLIAITVYGAPTMCQAFCVE